MHIRFIALALAFSALSHVVSAQVLPGKPKQDDHETPSQPPEGGIGMRHPQIQPLPPPPALQTPNPLVEPDEMSNTALDENRRCKEYRIRTGKEHEACKH